MYVYIYIYVYTYIHSCHLSSRSDAQVMGRPSGAFPCTPSPFALEMQLASTTKYSSISSGGETPAPCSFCLFACFTLHVAACVVVVSLNVVGTLRGRYLPWTSLLGSFSRCFVWREHGYKPSAQAFASLSWASFCVHFMSFTSCFSFLACHVSFFIAPFYVLDWKHSMPNKLRFPFS